MVKLGGVSLGLKGINIPLGGDLPGGRFGFGGMYPSTRKDYALEAGDPLENSIVMGCLTWIIDTFPQAPLRVVQRGTTGSASLVTEIPNHPLVQKFRRPNPFYSGSVLWKGVLISYNVAGNGYILMTRDESDMIAELWYEPHYSIRPHFPQDGSIFIDGYQVMRKGRWLDQPGQLIPVRDVLHFRNGIDPTDTRMGLSPLKAVLREIFTDNEAAQYTAAVLTNRGIPGGIVSPKIDGQTITDPDGLKDKLETRTKSDRRGEWLVLSTPLDFELPSIDPKSMLLDKLRMVPEARISGALNIPAILAGLGIGYVSSTYNNVKEAESRGWEENIQPTHDVFCEELDIKVLPNFVANPDSQNCEFDTRGVPALQEDQNELYARITPAWNGGWLKRSTALQMAGHDFDPERDDVYKTDIVTRTEEVTEKEEAPDLLDDEGQVEEEDPPADEEDDEPDEDGKE